MKYETPSWARSTYPRPVAQTYEVKFYDSPKTKAPKISSVETPFILMQKFGGGGIITSISLVDRNTAGVEVTVTWPSGSQAVFAGTELIWNVDHWEHRA